MTPAEQIAALEAETAQLQAKLDGLDAQIAADSTKIDALATAQAEAGSKTDKILALLEAKPSDSEASAATKAPDPVKEPEAPKAEVKPELDDKAAANGLTMADLKEALEASNASLKATIDERLEDIENGRREAALTKSPDREDDIATDAKVGGEDTKEAPAPTWDAVFESDKEVNPHGFKANAIPDTKLGMKTLRKMQEKHGRRADFTDEKAKTAMASITETNASADRAGVRVINITG